MPREIDRAKQRKALRKLRKAAERAAQGLGPPLSDWERTFLEEVEARIETYGSAFADPDKGRLEDPLSALQSEKLREIDRKARGKARGKASGKARGRDGALTTRRSLGRKSSLGARCPPDRPGNDAMGDAATDIEGDGEAARPAPAPAGDRPVLRVIKGGRDD